VRSYTGYLEPSSGSVRRRELPTGDVALVISFGPSLTIADPRSGSVVTRSSFVAGVHDGYALTQTPGRQHGIEVRLTPIGAFRLLGVAMNGVANRTVAFEELVGRDAELLAERLAALGSWQARFAALDSDLARLMREGPAASPSTVWAWRRLVDTSGRVSIASLVEELGCSRKHVAERFRAEIGLPPKTLARVLRFGRAVRLLRAGRACGEVALECGYYDQPHLNRDIRDLAGVTPTELTAVTSVQDTALRAG
jgi:AraC-like DNA-binding protein